MKLSAWIKTLNPLAILDQFATIADFHERTEQNCDWPVHRWIECKHRASLTISIMPSDSSKVCYAYELSQFLCREFTGVDPLDSSRRDRDADVGSAGRKMDIWSKGIEILERYGM